MATRYLDKEGLAYFWTKIKAYFTDHTPTALSQLTDDSTHRVVTDTQINTWNAAEPNQNAFSNVKVGSTTVAADGKTDTVEFVAGANITLTPDATNDKITIAVTDTSGEANQNAFSIIKVTPASGSSTDIDADTKTDTLELKAGSNITLTPDATNDKITIAASVPVAATADPIMDGTAAVGSSTKYAKEDHVHPSDTSKQDKIDSSHKLSADLIQDGTTNAAYTQTEKTKLSGIETGAEVNQNAFSTVKVTPASGASTDIAADAKTDTLELKAGNNITLTPDATNDKITIAVTGISSGAEVNQNAFSNVKVGSTTIEADSKTDTLEIAAGTGITVTPDATNDKVTIGLDSHTHGNITNDGKLQTSDVTIANGDKLVITDASDSNKVARASVTFDGSTTTQALSKKGTWETYILSSEKGAASGVCPLDSNAKIDTSYLPSYVDDVVEVYGRTGSTPLTSAWLSTTSASGSALTPEAGVIYVLMEDFTVNAGTANEETYYANSQYRWGGSTYVKLSDGSGVSPITNAEIDSITDADIPSLAA